jgi:hypothetical protein
VRCCREHNGSHRIGAQACREQAANYGAGAISRNWEVDVRGEVQSRPALRGDRRHGDLRTQIGCPNLGAGPSTDSPTDPLTVTRWGSKCGLSVTKRPHACSKCPDSRARQTAPRGPLARPRLMLCRAPVLEVMQSRRDEAGRLDVGREGARSQRLSTANLTNRQAPPWTILLVRISRLRRALHPEVAHPPAALAVLKRGRQRQLGRVIRPAIRVAGAGSPMAGRLDAGGELATAEGIYTMVERRVSHRRAHAADLA